jgi:2-dehydro-3-deoxyphosphogluconate aldolase/(4S)-4-hydroxy-2-oxoglutarate aldolase
MRKILQRTPVIPVLTIAKASEAVPLAEALCAGGLSVLEVTLRTPAALAAIETLRRLLPEAVVGAGTVLSPAQLASAAAAGAQFVVAPGYSARLASAARRAGVPLLPGVVTPGEIMAALAGGIDTVKLFPSESVGGIALLRAYAAPFPDVAFCPTGGITLELARRYLAEPNVLCVGMSSLAPAAQVAAGDWAAVRALAAAAAALRERGPAA